MFSVMLTTVPSAKLGFAEPCVLGRNRLFVLRCAVRRTGAHPWSPWTPVFFFLFTTWWCMACRNARAKAVEKTGKKKDWDEGFRNTYASLANDAAQLRVRLLRRHLRPVKH